MPDTFPRTGLQLRSLVTADGRLELSLVDEPVVAPGDDEVLVRVEAAPINPSDLGLLLGGADMRSATAGGTTDRPVITAPVAPEVLRGLAGRLDQSLPVGNEGGGVVVAAGSSPEAQALVGRTVGVLGGAMYGQYRTLKVAQCLALPDGVTPMQGASCFVNPLTALGMVSTMRAEGHHALVHTAAASNLGQMLVKLCLADGIELVNVVRKPEHVELLHGLGARHVVDSSQPSFTDDLTAALVATGATIAFDAIGGGRQAGQILACMEAAINASAKEYSRYGSSTHKQVYVYGGLDRGPTQFDRTFGMAWSIGGWLLTPFLQKIGPAGTAALRQRVADEITTTFASHYTDEVSLPGVLSMDAIRTYGKMATGQKFLVRPHWAG
jgi:NADPH2:quinone reductase